tara:strand:- start:156 stop:443 length:288 start_codon:yes stop_codon:yes gene_type:complete
MPANIKDKKKKYGKSGMVSYKKGGTLKPVYNENGVKVPGMFEDGGAVVNAAKEAYNNSKKMKKNKGSFEGYIKYMGSQKGKKKQGRGIKKVREDQ